MANGALNDDKLRGGYYTPPAVAYWLTRWAIRSASDHVLEPSCGDGVFLHATVSELARHRMAGTEREPQVVGVELIASEANRAMAGIANSPVAKHVEIVTGDFFSWLTSSKHHTFDVVLGNPPFIRYQQFPEHSRTLAMQLMQAQGLRPNKLTNIWVPFVVAATRLLRPNGRFAMVLPAELLQVSYAAQLRQYLASNFRRLTVFACNEMFFDNAEQEVILVLAEQKRSAPDGHDGCDLSLTEADTLGELLRTAPKTKRRQAERKYVQHDCEKWLKYFLEREEIDLLRSLRDHEAVGTLGDHAAVDVGVVTGKNDFFVLTHEQVKEYELGDFVVPLVGRSAQLSGAVLWKREHEELVRQGKPVHLLHLARCTPEQFTVGLRDLIAWGERRGFHAGYKCRIRDPWYNVPSVWEPDCFFFRQIYDFPRVVLNKAGATSTDTIHRMKCAGDSARLAGSLYTHLTAASAEVEGRSYGGGVLELEPTEAERLLVPKKLNGAMPIQEADKLIRQGLLAEVLEYNDRVVLREALGLSARDCTMLKGIWTKMRDRRMARKRRQSPSFSSPNSAPPGASLWAFDGL
jgi:adenine-specific DNA-methyltransferase